MKILKRSYETFAILESEVARYAGASLTDKATRELIRSSITEATPLITGRVCYTRLNLQICGDMCDFNAFSILSKNLAKNLKGCREAVIFAATVGLEIDRLIKKYGSVSPSRALILSAIGTEAVECVANTFSTDIEKEYDMHLRPRFSAGYGDVPLEAQREIFRILDAPRNIGVSLTEGLIMSPTKSVTAFIGLE